MNRLLGALGWLGVALVVGAVVLRFTRPALVAWYQPLAIAGFVVTLLYSLTQWRDIRRSFQGRSVRYGSIAFSSILLVLGILVGLNWISSRENKRWDLTAGGQFSISDQTKALLTGLKQPVTVRVFHAGGLDEIHDRLDQYTYMSKQLTAEYMDVRQKPLEAQGAGITQGTVLPTFVFEYSGRQEKTSGSDEQSLTNALKKVIEGQAKKVYFLQGHGEHDDTSSDQAGYSGFADALKSDNFDVSRVALAQETKVPDDASVLVIAGPQTDYLAPEIDALGAFLKRGGKVLVLLDPPEKVDAPALSNLIAFAKSWGIDVGTNVVLDQQSMQSPANPVVVTYPPHPVTEKLNRRLTMFSIARTATPVEGGVNGHTAQKLLETSADSFAETDLTVLGGKTPAKLDTADQPGPVSIGAAVSADAPDAPAPASPDAPKPQARVIVAGDSDFLSNAVLGFQGNRDLGLNMAGWLAQQENSLAIRPTSPDNRPLAMTPNQRFWIPIFALFIAPGLLLANAARVFWKKR